MTHTPVPKGWSTPLAGRLAELGCRWPAPRFKQAVKEVFEANYPGWTDDQLICDSPEAMRFCDRVRERVGEPGLPCDLINHTLQNLRKNRAHQREGRRDGPSLELFRD